MVMHADRLARLKGHDVEHFGAAAQLLRREYLPRHRVALTAAQMVLYLNVHFVIHFIHFQNAPYL